MRVTNRISSLGTFTGNRAAKRHKKTPSKDLGSAILSDSTSESKTLQYMPGVGPARAALLARLGLTNEESLLNYLPREYEDRRPRYRIKELPPGEKTALRGTITKVEFSRTRSGLGFASAWISDGSGEIEAVWFKRITPRYDVFAPLRNQLQVGQTIWVYGSVEWGPHGKQFRVDDKSMGDDPVHFNRIVPVYPLTEGISDRLVRTLTAKVLSDGWPEKAQGATPAWMAEHYQLPPRSKSLRAIHFPDTLLQKEEARVALAFEEFLILETALALLRRDVKKIDKKHRYELKRNLLTPFREKLGFELTGAQKRVIREVFEDAQSPHPMNRLIQGDVGSGKTLVALCTMLLAVENGYQAALMAPTEILAEQHARTITRLMGDLPVSVCLLTGRQTTAQRKTAHEAIASGQANIVIGTHALIQSTVKFASLKMVVIDEQHRFGVDHRRLLREKGHQTDMLVMTATPIPRTLALTLYGDLDVSVIDELPPGRTPIVTSLETEESAYRLILNAVDQKQQAYLVYPLVSESDKVELKAAIQEAEELQRTVFARCRVGLLHGQMKSQEKEDVMTRFRNREIDILIATTIIEVGIDVPNSTIMAIQHAERFGLATLHQLRGRVGRGHLASRCLLITHVRSGDGRERMQLMTETSDGFRLSEEDLRMRGPGEILGELQHGTPLFRAGDLSRDALLIQRTKQAADLLIQRDPSLTDPDHRALLQQVQRHYGRKWSLGATA